VAVGSPAAAEEAAGSRVSGCMSLDVNTNFTSCGVDVWGGLSYSYEKFSAGVTYPEWMYPVNGKGGSKHILDVNLAYDIMFSPRILIHSRVGSNNLGQATGSVFVFGATYGFDLGPVGLSVPVAAAALTTDFYIADQAGFGYVSAGLQASLPLSFNGGGTYFYSSEDNIGNADDNIFAMNAGISLNF
jgi:hypothetical protein